VTLSLKPFLQPIGKELNVAAAIQATLVALCDTIGRIQHQKSFRVVYVMSLSRFKCNPSGQFSGLKLYFVKQLNISCAKSGRDIDGYSNQRLPKFSYNGGACNYFGPLSARQPLNIGYFYHQLSELSAEAAQDYQRLRGGTIVLHGLLRVRDFKRFCRQCTLLGHSLELSHDIVDRDDCDSDRRYADNQSLVALQPKFCAGQIGLSGFAGSYIAPTGHALDQPWSDDNREQAEQVKERRFQLLHYDAHPRGKICHGAHWSAMAVAA